MENKRNITSIVTSGAIREVLDALCDEDRPFEATIKKGCVRGEWIVSVSFDESGFRHFYKLINRN